ncbi:MAG: PIN domain-containing protein [Spirochaetales bacterium]
MSLLQPEVFLDTDVILDLGLDREPFGVVALHLFARIEAGTVSAATSTLVLVNAYYVLRKAAGHSKALAFLADLTSKVRPLGTDAGAWRLAVASGWGDLEDAVQHSIAVAAGVDAVITRNTDDWKGSAVPVYQPDEWLALVPQAESQSE